ncbi:reverse transcriptase domain-containing protein, partial [Clostridium butyricum]
KKLKSYYYYDKTLLYIKDKIAEFEYDNELFNESLKLIANNLVSHNEEYFDELIKRIDFIVLPKSFESLNNDNNKNNTVIKCNVDHNKDIKKINFFIDLPIELLIVDTLWMLFIAKIARDNFGEFKYSYAGKMKKSLFNKEQSLYNGIDFQSNRCFEPYFKQYSLWRNRAFDSVKKYHDNSDVVMITLDLKSFYYSVRFDFDKLNDMLNNDKRLNEIKFITQILHKVYMKYTKLISKYRKGIMESDKYSVLPIGLLSPIVLRELYLKRMDEELTQKTNAFYYGRYVDDILLVLSTTNDTKDYSVDEYIHKYLVETKIVSNSDRKGIYKFLQYKNVRIQKEKVNCFYFEKGVKDILVEIYDKSIRTNSSEANMLPDIDLLNKSFNSRAYDINTSDGSSKIRNLEFMKSNNYNATLFVNGLKRLIKNTKFEMSEIEKYLDEILEFYDKSQGVEFSGSWRSIFELFVLCSDKVRAKKFYKNMSNYIESLSFNLLEDVILSNKKNAVLNRLKRNLKKKLSSSLALAVSLNYNIGILKSVDLSKKFRNANMMNHKLISYPLINYSKSNKYYDISLINLNTQEILLETEARRELFDLDEEKLKWTPRFIHLDELYFCVFLYNIGTNYKMYRKNNDEIFHKYLKINNLPNAMNNPIINDEIHELNGISIETQDIYVEENSNSNKTRIGLVNTRVSEEDVLEYILNPLEGMTPDKKERLYKVLETAREEGVQYLVFPEFYLPVLWLYDISNFSRQYGITIITGLQYITCNNKAYNIVCVMKSVQNKFGFRNCIPLYREKNHYAPDEKIDLAKMGYECKDATEPLYYIINNGNVSMGVILCFEFTDINSRAGMKSKVDLLFIPQLNRDTNYFSSIVESAARDLHCFVVQANTSAYGDSRITAPYKTNFKDIARIKGGINDVVIVGEVDVAELKQHQRQYKVNLEKQIAGCMKCKKISKNLKDMNRICGKCSKNVHKGKIKGLPPNFDLK